MEERHVLASMEAGKWIVTLHSAFHDETNLYLVMDFLGGGDLATLILRDGEDEFHMTEDVCRFYAAEILLALEELHKCGYMHRYTTSTSAYD